MPEDPEFIAQARREGRISSDVGVNLDFFQTAGKVPSCTIPAFASEKDFQQAVISLAHSSANIGGPWRVAHFRAARVMRNGKEKYECPVAADGKGFPDLILVRRDQIIAAELKFGKNKASKEQREWLAALSFAGVDAVLWYPSDWPEIVKTLE